MKYFLSRVLNETFIHCNTWGEKKQILLFGMVGRFTRSFTALNTQQRAAEVSGPYGSKEYEVFERRFSPVLPSPKEKDVLWAALHKELALRLQLPIQKEKMTASLLQIFL